MPPLLSRNWRPKRQPDRTPRSSRPCFAGPATPRRRAVPRSRSRRAPTTSSASTSGSPGADRARARPAAPVHVNVDFQLRSINRSPAATPSIGLSGIEDTPARRDDARRHGALLRIPRSARACATPTPRDSSTLADLGDRASARSSGTIAYEILLRAGTRSRRSTPSRTTTTCIRYSGSGARTDRRRAARQRPRRAARTGRWRDSRFSRRRVAIGHYVGVLSRGERAAARTASTRSLRARDARRHARSASSAKWRVWNDDQPKLHAQVARRRAGARRSIGLDTSASVCDRCRAGRRRGGICRRCCEPRSVTIAAVVPVDGARGRHRRRHRHRPRLRRTRHAQLALTGYVELDSRHADPAAAVRALLRPGGGDPAARLRRRAARPGAELRRLRKRDLPRRRSKRCSTGQLEAARTLGFSERQVLTLVRAPQAFRLALAPMTNDFVAHAEGLVARVGADRARADQADADLCDQPRQLGHSRHSVRGALSGDVAAAVGRWRGGSNGGGRRRRVSDAVLRIADVHLRRAPDPILVGVTLRRRSAASSSRMMGPSGSGKTTILRAVAGLEPFRSGRDRSSTA